MFGTFAFRYPCSAVESRITRIGYAVTSVSHFLQLEGLVSRGGMHGTCRNVSCRVVSCLVPKVIQRTKETPQASANLSIPLKIGLSGATSFFFFPKTGATRGLRRMKVMIHFFPRGSCSPFIFNIRAARTTTL